MFPFDWELCSANSLSKHRDLGPAIASLGPCPHLASMGCAVSSSSSSLLVCAQKFSSTLTTTTKQRSKAPCMNQRITVALLGSNGCCTHKPLQWAQPWSLGLGFPISIMDSFKSRQSGFDSAFLEFQSRPLWSPHLHAFHRVWGSRSGAGGWLA